MLKWFEKNFSIDINKSVIEASGPAFILVYFPLLVPLKIKKKRNKDKARTAAYNNSHISTAFARRWWILSPNFSGSFRCDIFKGDIIKRQPHIIHIENKLRFVLDI
jgi:hypothetical protein